MSLPHKKEDLTRWNRAGLSRFSYVEGNAVTYLETLRLAMVEAFTDVEGNNQWAALGSAAPAQSNETAKERRTRWLAQYRDERREYGWEILRSYSRAAHVLTGHLDAYANESYIGTATQWDSVRRLVEMLDYHPAPPASAETSMVLLAKADRSGRVDAGFAVKNSPEDGSKPAIFETLEDLEIAAEMNTLRPEDWERSQRPFIYADGSYTATFPLSEAVEGVAVGTLGLLLIEKSSGSDVAVYVQVTSVSDTALELLGESKPAGFPSSVKRHQVRLLLKPDYKQSPQLTGSNVALLSADHGLVNGSVVAWKQGSWRVAKVESVDGNRVQLSRTAPAEGKDLYLATYADPPDEESGDTGQKRLILPTHRTGAREYLALWDESLSRITTHYHAKEGDIFLYDYLLDASILRAYYVPVAASIASVQASAPQGLMLDGSPGDLADGDWVIAETSSGHKAAYITELNEGEKSFELKLSRTLINIETLFGNFELDLRPLNYAVNETAVFETASEFRSDSHSHIPLQLDEIPALLEIGRQLIIAGKSEAMLVTLKAVDRVAKRIKVEPAIPGSEAGGSGTSDNYSRHETAIYGNVVNAGHGESQGEKILGSGDAAKSQQRFGFAVEEVSFVADSSFPSGVRAALEITVENRTWKQVAVLSDSDPEDPHYVVRMNEDATLNIGFGDGKHGRRLPTGANNVRIQYRVGVGLAGNLTPLSLKKAVKPHHLIDEVVQSIASSGGNSMEDVPSMRENAPASVLTLERAVSLADFTHLATSNSSVWQARAIRLQPGMARKDKVEVVVVPAGGGALGTLQETLESTLTQHALPSVAVSVTLFKSVILNLTITIRVKGEEYDPEFIAEDLRQALFEAFALKQVKLGEPLFRSQVIEVAEGVEGVENCDCLINPDGFYDESGATVTPKRLITGSGGVIKRVSLDERQAIYMDETLSKLEIVTQPFSL
ncbi:MAG: baseplate J/gp47 family protein [Candidatus Polarisedimenticolaceae bacterium]|nr:baseplate J/gp47 family protein [Candidatus Polarisedimenticolaceae bacterium]